MVRLPLVVAVMVWGLITSWFEPVGVAKTITLPES
jgi:hypothetical protein